MDPPPGLSRMRHCWYGTTAHAENADLDTFAGLLDSIDATAVAQTLFADIDIDSLTDPQAILSLFISTGLMDKNFVKKRLSDALTRKHPKYCAETDIIFRSKRKSRHHPQGRRN
jgi:hypothetical protein